MSDELANNLPATIEAPPSPSPSSLQGDAAASKGVIEKWIGVSDSPYYRGIPGEMSAELVQWHYRNLLRGELLGVSGAVGPAHEIDVDHPMHDGLYDISAAPGSRSMTAFQREVADLFLPIAWKAGLGQRKVADAIGYVLTTVGEPDVERARDRFRGFARERGWSEQAIKVCLDFDAAVARGVAETRALPRPAAAAAAAPARSDAATRRAEIEQLMYVGGKPNPVYWSNEALQSEYRELVRPR